MKFKQWMFACSMGLVSFGSFAAQPTDQQVQKLMKIMNIDQLLQQTILQIRPQLDQQAYAIVQNTVKHEQLSPQEQIVANQLSDKMFEQSKKTVSWEKLQPIYQKIYKDVYSADEVQAQIDFYSSPVGQSILKKAPLVAQESMKIMNASLASSIQATESDFKEINTQLEQLQKAAQEASAK